MPERVQLRRTKGWRKPEGSVVVARPTKWGNPFTIAAAKEAGYDEVPDLSGGIRDATGAEMHQFVAWVFRDWLEKGRRSDYWSPGGADRHAWMTEHLPDLAGKDLACWCPLGVECHADVLMDLANREAA